MKTVGVNYQWPEDLHWAIKEVSKYDGLPLKQVLFEAAAWYVNARANRDPKLAQFLRNAGIKL